MSRQVSLRLPTRLLEALDQRARRRRRPRTDLIREALVAYLELPEGALTGRPVVDRVRGLLGSLDNLPADLATHAQDYLEDLGRRR